MSDIEVILPVKHQVEDADEQELAMLRKLGVLKVMAFAGTDEDNEKAWLEGLGVKDDEVLYVVEPASESKQSNS